MSSNMEPNYRNSDKTEDVEANLNDIKPEQPLKKKKWNYFREYCENSSIHGMKYLGEHKRPALERIWWIITFIISIYCCGALILSIWRKWQTNPVIVTFSDTSTPVWKIPFPAITICPDSNFHQDDFNITTLIMENKKFSTEELEILNALALVCSRNLPSKDGEKTINASIISKLEEMTTPMDEILDICIWENVINDCTVFSRTITEDGICFTSNILTQSELFYNESIQNEYPYVYHNTSSGGWSLEHGYPDDNDATTYPYRSLGAGSNFQLQIYLTAKRKSLDSLCKFGNQGYKVLLHHPADFPRISQQYFRLPLDQEVVVSVKPNVMTTSERLRSYDPQRRQCYFPSERKLMFYKTYTQGNCEIECLANYTLRRCGCVTFSMPRNKSTPICGPGSMYCKWRAQDELILRGTSMETQEMLNAETGMNCDCLATCTSIQYEVELSQSPFDLKPLGSIVKEYNTTLFALSRVSIYFREPQIITSHRSELYGYTDFLANCGGLLGLFMGVSILSVIEVIYFASLRFFYTIRMRLRTNGRKERSKNNET